MYCSFVEQLLCPCPTIRYPVSVSLCWACLLCHLNISLLYNRVLCGITEQRMMDYACTLQFSLLHGPKRLQFLSKYANKFINITIGTMQLGFCMAYLVFIGEFISNACCLFLRNLDWKWMILTILLCPASSIRQTVGPSVRSTIN